MRKLFFSISRSVPYTHHAALPFANGIICRGLTLVLLLIGLLSFAQAPPQGINYQAAARDTSGRIMSNCLNLSVKFTIWDSISGGDSVFAEIHNSVTTNRYGLFTRIIGSADPIGFDSIKWGIGNKFLEVGIDPLGGNNFTSMGRTQMMSVPYALYAKKAGNEGWSLSGNSANQSNFIGTTNFRPLHFRTNDILRMIIDSLGRVGIGTSAPGNKLEVFTGTNALTRALYLNTGTHEGTAFNISATTNNESMLDINVFRGGIMEPRLSVYSNGNMSLQANGGNVGIGISNPTAMLEVAGQIKINGGNPASGSVLTSDASGLAAWAPPTSSPIYNPGTGLTLSGTTFNSVWTAFGTDIYNNNLGNVGIRTAAPHSELEVVSTAINSPHGIVGTEYNSNPGADSHIWLRKARGTESSPLPVQANDEIGSIKFRGWDITNGFNTSDQTEIAAAASEPFTGSANGSFLKFMTTLNGTIIGSERMRIDHNGNIGIGNIAPTALLDVSGSINITGGNTSEVNRTQTSGANLVPIAYGSVNANGTQNANTGNISVVWDNSNNYFIITILGEVYTSVGYITMVTPIGDNVKASTSSSGGNLIVTFHDATAFANKVANAFQFITYKP